MKRHLIAATVCLLAMSGCSNETDTPDAPDGPIAEADMAAMATPQTADPAQSQDNQEALVQTLASKMQPGLWELNFTISTIDAPDAPAMMRKPMEALKGSTQSFRHCLPAGQSGRPDPEFFGNDSTNDCTYDQFSQSGDFATISMTCGASGGRRARTDMQGTLGERAFDLSMANEVLDSPNGKIKLAGKLKGKRVGDCEG